MMELMTYAGHLECYGKSNEILHRFMDIDVSPAQIYRVTDLVSELLEEKLDAEERILPPLERDDMLYVEVDGSMVHIREEGWKEAKVGRLFKGSDCLNPNSDSSCLTNSHYVAHLGNHTDFCELTEQAISSYGRYRTGIVFITDGATWIKNWIEEAYPDAYAILDYFHVCEYLYAFADSCFGKDVRAKDDWCDTQKKLLLESKVEIVLDNIRNTPAKEKDKEKLLNYYQKNISRMDYKRFKSIGCGIIGSGAIESAHRTVIQKRMKLSGQHWTRNGAVNMLRLRVVSMNKQWHKVIDLLKQPMQYDRAAA
jgi:hypothetical protein